MSTATTTLTRTNCAISTKITKNIGAIMVLTQQFFTQSAASSQSSLRVSFMIPFQLSPVATRKSVRNAIPKLLKCACSPRPWQGMSSLHSAIINIHRGLNSYRNCTIIRYYNIKYTTWTAVDRNCNKAGKTIVRERISKER